MKKLDLNTAADEFDMISDETHLFYNTETGEFDFYADFMELGDADAEKFEKDCWVAAPSQRDLNEYDFMADFTDTVTDSRKNELLSVALEGRGAFRRFKDTLRRVDLLDHWYAFRHDAYVELAREWCEENEIPYVDSVKNGEPQTTPSSKPACSDDVIVIPLVQKIADDAAEALCDALGYSRQNAAAEVKRMLSSKRIALAVITADMHVAGIIGAIPQYDRLGAASPCCVEGVSRAWVRQAVGSGS